MSRRTVRYPVSCGTSLWQLYKTVSFWKVVKNTIIIQIAKFTPFLSVKNWLFRTFLKMKIGKRTAFGFASIPDIMFPEMITIGSDTIIGYHATILAHEYLVAEYRLGKVEIGNRVMIGANTTILPGVKIGDDAVISAGSLIHGDVPSGAFVGGNPMSIIRGGNNKV